MIELCNGYYIEVDAMNYTLKKRYEGERKETGEKFDAEKVCGYFSGLDGALEKFVKLNQIDFLPHTGMDLGAYLELVVKSNEEAVRAIKSVVEGRLKTDAIREFAEQVIGDLDVFKKTSEDDYAGLGCEDDFGAMNAYAHAIEIVKQRMDLV